MYFSVYCCALHVYAGMRTEAHFNTRSSRCCSNDIEVFVWPGHTSQWRSRQGASHMRVHMMVRCAYCFESAPCAATAAVAFDCGCILVFLHLNEVSVMQRRLYLYHIVCYVSDFCNAVCGSVRADGLPCAFHGFHV